MSDFDSLLELFKKVQASSIVMYKNPNIKENVVKFSDVLSGFIDYAHDDILDQLSGEEITDEVYEHLKHHLEKLRNHNEYFARGEFWKHTSETVIYGDAHIVLRLIGEVLEKLDAESIYQLAFR